MAKVTCLKDVSIGSLDRAFVKGEQYDIPVKEAKAYTEYFQIIETNKTTKKQETEENK
tara:strand:+ start:28 stop:201 length:174 start_codon:yes stop_codon:yes gene_type:complete